MTGRLSRFLILAALLLSVVVHNPMLLLLDFIVLIVAFTAWLWGRYCLAGVSYARQFGTERLFVGEETDFWVEIVNAKPLPLTWLKTEDEFPHELPIHRADLKLSARPQRHMLVNLFSLRWYERVRRHYRLKGEQRGTYIIGPVRMASGDLFGFRVQRSLLDYRHMLLVYPKIVALEQLGLPSAKPLGDYGSERHLIDDPLRIAGARDYQAGDSVRYVHWKATAHRGELQTRVFDPSAAPHWMVCLNTQTLEHIYEGVVTDYLETAIVVAASLVHAGLETRRSVGLASNSSIRGAPPWIHIAASRHNAQELRILEALAQLTYPPLMSFEDLLRLEALRLPYGASIFAVTPLVNAAIIKALFDLRAKGHPVAMITVGRRPEHPLPPGIPTHCVTQNWTEFEGLKLEFR